MQLNFQTYGTGFPLLILHGLFGSLDNWNTVSRRLGETCQVFALDLRNHGRSPHSELLNYEVMAADVAEFMQTHDLRRAHLLGHSMGGKVAMRFALRYPDLVEKLIVADMSPKAYPPWHLSILAALKALDLAAFQNRNELDTALAPAIPEPAVRQFLLKNVTRNEQGKFEWKMNLAAIDQHYPQLIQAIESDQQFEGPALFLNGGQSDYLQPTDHDLVRKLFPQAQFSTIPNVGHWLHAEAPEEFIKAVASFTR
ncbi:MAG: alpha/beta hydrolase [Pedosphaera sp.]|nr:alpha/beta hydrolase [Pedosphaera sp.]